jgi:hypothetical protein
VQAIDPNVKKTWLVNDEGKPAAKGETKHFKPGEFLKWTGQTAWRIVSKNQGEDWAAAIPYAFQMKFQRQFLSNVMSKRWDGHKLVFDQGWNGGAYKVNQQGKIVGDYQLVGALDLHARFTGYNWYTLMFREGYDSLGNAINRWKKGEGFFQNDPEKEDKNPIMAAVDNVLDAGRYVTKSFIKANLYMNPAVIPFWAIRVPQSKWRPENHVAQGIGGAAIAGANRENPYEGGMFGGKQYDHYATNTTFDKVEKGFSRVLHPIGKFSNYIGNKAASASDRWESKGWWPGQSSMLGRVVGQGESRREFMHQYTDAMLSYTPYIIAKAEFGLRVDDSKGDGKLGQMDKAIYSLMDNASSFKLRKTWESMKLIHKLGTNFEREVKAREGGDPTAQEIAKTPEEHSIPKTTVDAKGLMRQPHSILRGEAANDPEMSTDKRWAQMVMGGDYNAARVHSGSPTRH